MYLYFIFNNIKNLAVELIFKQKIRCLFCEGPTFSVKLGAGPGFSGGGSKYSVTPVQRMALAH